MQGAFALGFFLELFLYERWDFSTVSKIQPKIIFLLEFLDTRQKLPGLGFQETDPDGYEEKFGFRSAVFSKFTRSDLNQE